MCCFKSPTLLLQLSPKFFDPLDLDVQFQKSSPLSPNENHSIKSKLNPRMTIYVIRSLLQVRFRFQYQVITLVWLSIDFFLFSWSQSRPQSNSTKLKFSFSPSSYSEKRRWGQGRAQALLSTFLWLYILVCAVVQIYHEMFFSTHFAINLFYLHNLKM